MALEIEWRGAQALLELLGRLGRGEPPADAEWQRALSANRFFVDYYCGWEGVTRENLLDTLRRCTEGAGLPDLPVLARLSQGFRQAALEGEALWQRLDRLRQIDASAILDRALPYLPSATPLQSTLHLTIDGNNGGFMSAGEIGLSLLREITDPEVFTPLVAHELHHAGFRYWAERDARRQALLAEPSGRAVAVRHVQNLLSEGLAIHYCSPLPALPDAAAPGDELPPWLAKMARYRREERALFAEADELVRRCLAPGADVVACRRACDGMVMDPEGIQPKGHYVGARMVETMARVHPQAAVIACVRALDDFLPLYNEAARQAGGYVFDAATAAQFRRLWDEDGGNRA